MIVLADTNIWVKHFRVNSPALTDLMLNNYLLMHPLVVGELAVGNLPHRPKTLAALRRIKSLTSASFDETLHLLDSQSLFGKGIQWNDALILASVLATPGTLLWTEDLRLNNIAASFHISYTPNPPT